MLSDHRDDIRTLDHDLEAEIISLETMHKLTLLILLLFLSSCTWLPVGTPDVSEQQLQQLREENTALREENTRLKAGSDPYTIENAFGPNVTYTEWNYESCIRDAHAAYISDGTEYCKKAGYSTGDILANKCQLDNSVIQELQMTESGAQAECKNLYK